VGDIAAFLAAPGTQALSSFAFNIDDKVVLSILKRTLTAITGYFSYSDTTSAHSNSFSGTSARPESCPR